MDNGVVLVTGASTGIGEATTRRLAGLGIEVLAGVRRARTVSVSPRRSSAEG